MDDTCSAIVPRVVILCVLVAVTLVLATQPATKFGVLVGMTVAVVTLLVNRQLRATVARRISLPGYWPGLIVLGVGELVVGLMVWLRFDVLRGLIVTALGIVTLCLVLWEAKDAVAHWK